MIEVFLPEQYVAAKIGQARLWRAMQAAGGIINHEIAAVNVFHRIAARQILVSDAQSSTSGRQESQFCGLLPYQYHRLTSLLPPMRMRIGGAATKHYGA